MRNKKEKGDFLESSLPSTRKKQFFDNLTHRYRLLLLIGIVLVTFFIPFLAALIYRDSSLMIIAAQGYEDEIQRMFSIEIIYSLLTIPCFIIFFIGLAGIMKVIKELVYSEPIFFKDDFLTGIKENWKPFIIIAIFVSIFNLMDTLLFNAFSNIYIRVIPASVNFALIFPLCFVSLLISMTYANKFFVTLRSAVIIYFIFFPRIILSFALTFGVLLFKYIPLFYVKYIVIIIYLLLVLPITILGTYESITNIFDELINKNQYPDYYKKGLFSKNDTNF